jgi:prephenate dehydrogenase
MGGSLARSLKGLPTPPLIKALSDQPEDLRAGLKAGVVDEVGGDVEAFLADLDLIVYCTPLNATLDLLSVHREFMGSTTLITDVASLKVPVLETVASLDLKESYLGSHPMAGGEGSGFVASKKGLFSGTKVWVTPEAAAPKVIDAIESFWGMLGGKVARIGASDHDLLMAWVSHLPQLTANALALSLQAAGVQSEELGPGGSDMTRLASSSPEMWLDLFQNAPPALLEGLEAVQKNLGKLKQFIRDGNTEGLEKCMRDTEVWKERDLER